MGVKEPHEPRKDPPERIRGTSSRSSNWARNNAYSPARLSYVIIHRALGTALRRDLLQEWGDN